jgi:DNA binding protein with HTH domain
VLGSSTLRTVPARHPLLVALEPVAGALGATLVPASRVGAGDIPLRWEGELVGGLRLPGVHGTLDRVIAAVESELGSPLAELSREDKQRAVKLLDERGAFQLRKAVEDVADALGVSRFTVYNYLNAGGTESESDPDPEARDR